MNSPDSNMYEIVEWRYENRGVVLREDDASLYDVYDVTNDALLSDDGEKIGTLKIDDAGKILAQPIDNDDWSVVDQDDIHVCIKLVLAGAIF